MKSQQYRIELVTALSWAFEGQLLHVQEDAGAEAARKGQGLREAGQATGRAEETGQIQVWSLKQNYCVCFFTFKDQEKSSIFTNTQSMFASRCFDAAFPCLHLLTVSFFLRSFGSRMQSDFEGQGRALCQLKMLFKGPRRRHNEFIGLNERD